MKVLEKIGLIPNYHRHGELYTHDGGMTVSLPTANAPVVSTGWTAGLATGSPHVVLDAANGTITIGDKGGGLYKIKGNASFSSSKANIVIHAYITVNGTKQDNIALRRNIQTVNAVGNANTQDGLVVLIPGDVVRFVFESDANTTTVSIDHGGFTIVWEAGE